MLRIFASILLWLYWFRHVIQYWTVFSEQYELHFIIAGLICHTNWMAEMEVTMLMSEDPSLPQLARRPGVPDVTSAVRGLSKPQDSSSGDPEWNSIQVHYSCTGLSVWIKHPLDKNVCEVIKWQKKCYFWTWIFPLGMLLQKSCSIIMCVYGFPETSSLKIYKNRKCRPLRRKCFLYIPLMSFNFMPAFLTL